MRALILALALALIAGCGGAETPVEKCDVIRVGLCDLWSQCLADQGVLLDRDACLRVGADTLRCATVVAVREPAYSTCMSKIEARACADFVVPAGVQVDCSATFSCPSGRVCQSDRRCMQVGPPAPGLIVPAACTGALAH